MDTRENELINGIVRILGRDDKTVGTGFIVSEDGLIASCAHVVEPALIKGKDVNLILHVTGESYTAKLKVWRDPKIEDIAILQLETPLPEQASVLWLGTSFSRGAEFKTFGFPGNKPVEGLWGYGDTGDFTTEKGCPVLQLQSKQVTHGFSGAPVFNIVTQRVVGMVTSITTPDRSGRLIETAFATPTASLQQACLELQFSQTCPYKGLSAFTEQDALFFHGRNHLINRLLDKLRKNSKFLVVCGSSGSGKSSLVQAGLIPCLRQGEVDGSEHWEIILTHPIDQTFGLIKQKSMNRSQDLIEAVREWQVQHPEKKRLVIFIDQFEELFANSSHEFIRNYVINLSNLLNSVLPVTVILTLRNDFYSQFTNKAGDLVEWLEQNDQRIVNVLRLKREDLEDIVRRPAEKVKLRIEPGLVEVIVKDALKTLPGSNRTDQIEVEDQIETDSSILPLLEFALDKLWEKRQDNTLTHKAYSLAPVAASLTEWADNTLNSDLLSKEHHPLAQRILTDLVHLGDENQGVPDSRQRRSFESLCRTERERKDVEQVVQALAKDRLLTVQQDSYSKPEFVELIHDILIQDWGLLRQWLKDKREFLVWYRQVEERTRSWQSTQPPDPGRLLRGEDLEQAREFVQKHPEDVSDSAKDFIQCSQIAVEEAARAARRAVRMRIAAATTVVVVTLGATAVVRNVRQQSESVQLIRNAALGVKTPTPSLARSLSQKLPAFVERANQAKNSGNVEQALSSYQTVVALKRFEQGVATTNNAEVFESVIQERQTIQTIATSAETALAEVIRQYKLPQLEAELKQGKIGEIRVIKQNPIEYASFADLENQFTEGALQTTYKILMQQDGANADIDGDGMLIEGEELLLPCDTLKEVEELWRRLTENRCGWYGEKDTRTASACRELGGQSLMTKITFPTSIPLVQKRLSDECQVVEVPKSTTQD